MTTHDDRTDLETRLRASLRERAEDVDTTPALYERVQHQASRRVWLNRGLALAGAAAVVVAAVAIVPPLLPDPTPLDIADTPEDAQPTEEPSEDAAPGVAPTALQQANVAYGDETGRVTVGQSVVTGSAAVASVAVHPLWTLDEGAVAAGLADGSLLVMTHDSGGQRGSDLFVDATANGGGVAFSPDGQAVAWIEGTDLHVLPLASAPDGERVLPLVGDVPDDLRIEQWFGQADAQLILASDPTGGVWRIPMDDSDAFNSAPTDPASLLPAAADPDAVDAALLEDTSLVVLRVPADGSQATLTVGGDSFVIDGVSDASAELTTIGGSPTVFDPTTGLGTRWSIDLDSYDVVAQWEAPGITAVAPLPDAGDSSDSGDDTELGPADASALGLPTGSPVIGTAGTDLVVRFADGEVRTLPLYPQPETEATLGRLAVMPGATTEDGLVAVESFSEGENSIRFAGLRDGEVAPVGDIIVTDGPVTGLVWSEDGAQLAWTDDGGLHVATVDEAGSVTAEEPLRSSPSVLDTRRVLDWVWTGTDGDAATGHLAVGVNGATGVELLGVDRAADGSLSMNGPAGGSDRLVLDVHSDVATIADVQVTAAVGGGTAELTWVGGADSTGRLANPGIVGGDVRVQVSGGHVLVMGDSRQVLVTFDGDVVDLPTAADWDVLD